MEGCDLLECLCSSSPLQEQRKMNTNNTHDRATVVASSPTAAASSRPRDDDNNKQNSKESEGEETDIIIMEEDHTTASQSIRKKSMDDLAKNVLQSLHIGDLMDNYGGRNNSKKNDDHQSKTPYLDKLESLLQLPSSSSISSRTNAAATASSVTLLQDYGPFDETKQLFYYSLAILLAEAFQPGCCSNSLIAATGGNSNPIVVSSSMDKNNDEEEKKKRENSKNIKLSHSSSTFTTDYNHNDDVTFPKQQEEEEEEVEEVHDEYSLLQNHITVRCARILNALVYLEHDDFSLKLLFQFAAASNNNNNEVHDDDCHMNTNNDDEEGEQGHDVNEKSSLTKIVTNPTGIPLLQAYLYYLSNLNILEGEVLSLQRKIRFAKNFENGSTSGGVGDDGSAPGRGLSDLSDDHMISPFYGKAIANHIAKAEHFKVRTDGELAQHVTIVATHLLSAIYRDGPVTVRKLLRMKIGSLLLAASTIGSASSSSTSYSASLSSTSAFLRRDKHSSGVIGVSNLLQTCYNIISGFKAPPLKKAHTGLLLDVLLPLHQPNGMILWRDQIPVIQLYHSNLVLCISKILDFDVLKPTSQQQQQSSHSPLVCQVILALLHPDIWPEGKTSNTPKVVLLLHEIDTLVQRHIGTNIELFQPVANRLVLRLCECISGDNSRTSERALQLWKGEVFADILIKSQLHSLMKPLMAALCRADSNMEPSWNPTVNKMSFLVIKKLDEQSPELFVATANEIFGDVHLKMNKADEKDAEIQKGGNVKVKSRTTIDPDVSGMISLKGAMGEWKPPVKSGSNRSGPAKSESSTGATAPPSTITGVAPWAMKHPSVPSRKPVSNPPLGITGVAPWAQGGGASLVHAGKKRNVTSKDESSRQMNFPAGSDGSATPAEVGAKNESDSLSGLTKVSGISRVRHFVNKIKPNEEVEGGVEGGMSSWASAQTSESPTLLPNLKFHDLVFGQDLGTGAFSTVKYARQILKEKTRSHWPEFAVKIISTKKILELGYEASVNREIVILRRFSHPGIARLISSFRFRDGAYLVLEYASGGDLHDYLKREGSLGHDSTVFVIGEVVAALLSIHEAGFVYSDLKPENILICESGHIKVADFGACRPVTEEAKQIVARQGRNALRTLRDGDWREVRVETFFNRRNASPVLEDKVSNGEDAAGYCCDDNRIEGTVAYLPPEVAVGGVPTIAADAWALGCVLYQCLSGRPPLLEHSEEATRHHIVTFELPQEDEEECWFFGHRETGTFRDESKSLVRRLLSRNAKDRPDMVMVSEDGFFHDVDPFSLFRKPAPPLMVGLVAPTKNAAWTRRQFSSIWAPQPVDFALDAPFSTPMTSGHFDKKGWVIREGKECDAPFFHARRMLQSLSCISETDRSL